MTEIRSNKIFRLTEGIFQHKISTVRLTRFEIMGERRFESSWYNWPDYDVIVWISNGVEKR